MNLIDAIRLYCHIMQRVGGGLDGRRAARDALIAEKVHTEVIDIIDQSVSNEGHITSGKGARFALTQISSS
jgi:hypothetical protein